MSLLELKLTLLEDVLKKNEDRWRNEYIRKHWKFVPRKEVKTMDLKEKMNKLKAIENDLIVKLEETVNKRMYDEAIKIAFLLIKVRKIETL